jgi:2'-5' RNA ligase
VATKTHTTAVVLIPPEQVWEPIQVIRRRHDRQCRRWMPHVTLLYPFRPREQFDDVAGALAQACRPLEPFQVELAEIRCFKRRRDCVLWLAPEPAEALRRLQEAVWRAAPDCDEVRAFENGFTPHLSIGQAGRDQVGELMAGLQRDWRPLRFRAAEVSLIYRGQPPDDVFRVDRPIPLGRRQ